jgi:hypothetical protein
MFKRFTEKQKQRCFNTSLITLGALFLVGLIVGIVGAVSGNVFMIGIGIGMAAMITAAGVAFRENNLARD